MDKISQWRLWIGRYWEIQLKWRRVYHFTVVVPCKTCKHSLIFKLLELPFKVVLSLVTVCLCVPPLWRHTYSNPLGPLGPLPFLSIHQMSSDSLASSPPACSTHLHTLFPLPSSALRFLGTTPSASSPASHPFISHSHKYRPTLSVCRCNIAWSGFVLVLKQFRQVKNRIQGVLLGLWKMVVPLVLISSGILFFQKLQKKSEAFKVVM